MSQNGNILSTFPNHFLLGKSNWIWGNLIKASGKVKKNCDAGMFGLKLDALA